MTKKQSHWTREDLANHALEASDAGGVDAVVAALKSIDDPTLAACAFGDLSQNLYRARKDVTNMIAVAEAGVAFCLDQVRHAESSEGAIALRTTAKTIAFNAGANCWPGWGDDGIEIVPTHIRSGLELAEACRNLVRELQLGPKQDRNGTWLVGALKLSAGEPAAALAEFRALQSSAEASGDAVNVLMAAGYCALARKAVAATASAGAQELEQELELALTQLRGLGSDEAIFFANQIATANKVLLAR